MLSPGQSAIGIGPSMQILSGEFYPWLGLDRRCGGGGESREVQAEGHTLNSMKDDRRVSPVEEEGRREKGGGRRRAGGVSKHLDRYVPTLDFDHRILSNSGTVIKICVAAQK